MAKITFHEDEVRNPNMTSDIAINWLNMMFGGGEVEIIRENKNIGKVCNKCGLLHGCHKEGCEKVSEKKQ